MDNNTTTLGEIKNVPLRKVWKNEAYDFTPWLVENLERLGEAIGFELEFEGKEVSVGPYSADILAKDAGTDTYVVIENQLEKTNHDHLGKCITYASVLDASAVIWIASNFTEEHKKALDWLNDHTHDDIGFYGVKLELWQIDNSQPAVKFNVISTPNTIVKQASNRKELGELTETRKIQYKFWTAFKEKLEQSGEIKSIQTPKPRYWFDIAIGKSGVHLSNTYNTDRNEIGIRVYINSKQVDEWFPYFESKKEEIETKIGTKLVWNPNPDNKDKIISLSKHFDLDNEKGWNEAIDWLAKETLKFREVFSNLIREKNIN
jgi:hypothetical protein